MKAPVQLILPLLNQAAGADDQAAPEVTAGNQLLDQQARHDGLASSRIISQQEAQWLPWQHRLVNGRDLVWKGVHERCVNREHGIKKVSKADPMSLRNKAKKRAVAVEAPWPASLDKFHARLVVAVENLVGNPSIRPPIHQCQSVRTMPLNAHNGDRGIRQDAAYTGFCLEFFEFHDIPSQTTWATFTGEKTQFSRGVLQSMDDFLPSLVR